MKRISFERSGGVMGRRVNLELDLAELAPEQSDLLERLIKEADFFKLPTNFIQRPVPDAFTYTITVRTTWRNHSVRFSDTTIPPSLQPLVDVLLATIKKQS